MNIFERASIEKLRFPSCKGLLATEQLWDLPLSSKTGFDLDTVAKTVNAELKNAAEESFVATTHNPAKALLELQLEVVKHIIAARLAANEQARLRSARAEERAKLTDILADKQDAALRSLTTEEIHVRLKELG
jgi:hypothetical protein